MEAAIWEPLHDGAAVEGDLLAPLEWPIGRAVEVCPLKDLFSGIVPEPVIDQIYAVMALCPHHQFVVATGRPEDRDRYLTTPHRPDQPGKFQTVLDDGRVIETPGAHMRAHSAMCDIFPKAPAAALNAAIDWQDEHCPGDGFMRRWPLPNVSYSP